MELLVIPGAFNTATSSGSYTTKEDRPQLSDEVCATMDWNSASLTQAAHQFPGNLTAPSHHGSQGATCASRGGNLLGSTKSELADDTEDRRPSTPRNVSPAVLVAAEFGDDGLEDENHDDLLVFGYGCKIFRDDERAQWIEEQKHLIPWMGNPDLLIDRYDCRGALMDISRYEPGSGYDNSQEVSEEDSEDLNSSYEQEQMLEQELDAERYKELNEDIDYDEGAYDKAADYKRLQTAMNGMLSEAQAGTNNTRNYAEFQYDYNAQNQDICIGPEPKKVPDEDAAYTKPLGLYIPEEIILPSTMKIHAIIEKTAKFIASQGNQMEIILKTKQSSNPLFDFLNHGGNLNSYYKFLVHAIRSGIYRPPSEQEEGGQAAGHNLSSEYSGSEEDSEHHTYLHPSLFRASNTGTGSALSSIDYPTVTTAMTSSATSSRHNAYSMLVSKIKGTDSPDPVPPQQPATSTLPPAYGMEYPALSHLQNSSSNQYNSTVFGYPMSSQQVPVQTPVKKLPSTSDQLIIEKMASYVIKNGATFEVLAKNKSDPRFGFLNPTHEYHWYYLNCKERFKAECTAVVASSDFVNYTGSATSTSSIISSNPVVTSNNLSNSPVRTGAPSSTNSTSPTIKKSAVAAELAELKRKNSGLLVKKVNPEKESKSLSASVGAENVFSQASLIQSKEKDKPVIRFASSLSLNVTPSSSSSSTSASLVPEESEPSRNYGASTKLPCLPQLKTTKEAQRPVGSSTEETPKPANAAITPSTLAAEDDEEEEEGEIRDTNDSDSDIYLLDDGGGNSTPASEDDEEKIRRRLERKRKATLFLQKLKMSKTCAGSAANSVLSSSVVAKGSVNSRMPSSDKSAGKSVPPGTSLGDLLVSRRLQTNQDKKITVAQPNRTISLPPEITISDSEDNGRPTVDRIGCSADTITNVQNSDSSKSTASSRHSSRGRSRNHTKSSSSRTSRKRRKRRKSRSYSSSPSPSRSPSSSGSSYDSNSHSTYSKKRSSKKKRKRKKKKYEKSSRSSHKSKRR